METIGQLFSFLWGQILSIRLADVIDILLVAVLLYYIISFFRDRRAGKLAVGVVFLLVALLISNLFQMRAIGFILEAVVSVGVLALIIIFQPELRALLERMGRGSLSGFGRFGHSHSKEGDIRLLETVCDAAGTLSTQKTGALIVMERDTKLGDEIRTGTVLDASITKPLILNIFYNKAPLHDGAMILRDGRIHSCGCFLPLSASAELDRNLGTRHRAALGLSEISDAVIIVVSEETGAISVARDGKLYRGFDRYTLENELLSLFADSDGAGERGISKLFSRFSRKEDAEETPTADESQDDKREGDE